MTKETDELISILFKSIDTARKNDNTRYGLFITIAKIKKANGVG